MKKQISLNFKGDLFDDSEDVQRQIFDFYIKKNPESAEKALIQFVGDTNFNLGALSGAESHARHGNQVFFYVFDYCNPDSFGALGALLPFKSRSTDTFIKNRKRLVPTHCTDLRYIVGEGVYSKFDPTEEELEMLDKMTTLFTNFAKSGNPNSSGSVEWEPYDLNLPGRHYHIGYPDSCMRSQYHNGRCEFLEEIRKNNKNYQEIFHGKSI